MSSAPQPESAKAGQAKTGVGKIFGLVALLTVVSKFVGLARDIVLLQAFGTGLVADAYNFAYLLTGNVLVLFGGLGGPFHSSCVSILTPKKHDENAGALCLQLFALTLSATTIIAFCAFYFAPEIIHILAPAQGHPQAYRTLFWHESVSQLRIMIPMIVIAGLVGISYGILNVFDKYFWPSLSPAVASVSLIASIALFANQVGGVCLAIGTLVGAFGQLLVQLPETISSGLKWRLSFKPEPGLASFFLMLGPAVISTSIGQLNVYVDAFFTSQLHEGAWTANMTVNRLIQLPLGVLLTAMLVPILPRFSLRVAEQKIDELKKEFRQALRFLWFLALPMAAMLFAVPGPIIHILFERGHFDETSRALTTTALVYLVPMIFFYVGRDLITRVFYAHRDSATPYYVGMVALVLKALFDWLLIKPFGIGGISLSTTLITVFNFAALGFLLSRKIGLLGTSELIKPTIIMLAASALAGTTTYFCHAALQSHLSHPIWLWQAAVLALSGMAGLTVYGLICLFLRLEETKLLMDKLKARFS